MRATCDMEETEERRKCEGDVEKSEETLQTINVEATGSKAKESHTLQIKY